MRRAGSDGEVPLAGRRLTLTPLGLDVILALAHDHRGLRLTPLATIIGSPVSSAQVALRILIRHRVVTMIRDELPVYRLAFHPAQDSLIDVALTTTDPAAAIAIVLRSSAAVDLALVDERGFVAGVDADADVGDQERLLGSLVRIREAHSDAPPVQMHGLDDLTRLLRISVGSRARLIAAVAIKGSLAAVEQARPGGRDAVGLGARWSPPRRPPGARSPRQDGPRRRR